MEEQAYIEIKVEGKIGNTPIMPQDIDIAEIKDVIVDIETFLYPTRAEKLDRPHISYKLEEGSARHIFYLPISGMLFFNALTTEISNRGNVDFLDYKRAEIIGKFQKKAREHNLEISFGSSVSSDKTLKITKETNFFNAAANYIETEMVLYGKVNSEGGNNPNFHILTKEYGKLTIDATQRQLLEGEKRLYKTYGVRATGKQNIVDGRPFDLKLIEYIDYNPVFDRSELDVLIARSAGNWDAVEDVDAWVNEIRGGSNG